MLFFIQYRAGVAELADARDLKSLGREAIRVRAPSPAPRRSKLCIACSDFFQKSGRARSAAPPFQTGPAVAGLRFGMPPCGRRFIFGENIDFDRPFFLGFTARRAAPPLDLKCSGRRSRPCAKVFTCGENACTAHSRRGPEGPLGALGFNFALPEFMSANVVSRGLRCMFSGIGRISRP